MSEKINENGFDPAEAQEPVTADDVKTDTGYEQNDNWEFEAEAHTLAETLVESDEYEITIPGNDAMPAEPVATPDAEPTDSVATDTDAPKPKRNSNNIIRFVLAGIAIIAIIAVVVFLGIRHYTVPNTDERMNPGNIAVTVNDTDVSIGMYNYYYSCISQNYISYAEYGYYDLDPAKDFSKQTTTDDDGNTITWAQMFENETLKQIQYITAYYEAAVNAGVTLTKDQEKLVQQNLDSIKKSASEVDMSVDEYIAANYGPYCGYATLKKMLEQCYIAESYYYQSMVETKATDKEIKSYYKKHSDDYLNVDFAFLQLQYTDKNKKKVLANADKYSKKINSLKSLKKYLPTACSDIIKKYVESGYYEDEETCAKALANACETVIAKSETGFIDEAVEWLFSDKTKVNDCSYFDDADNNVVYILLKKGEPTIAKDEVYSVRHILIMPEDDSDDDKDSDADDEHSHDDADTKKEYTKEQWDAAKAKADKILKQYNSGKKTEYSFAKLAEKYSQDTESTSSGSSGIYGGLCAGTPLGMMVKSFEEWSTDEKREYGDTGIVKSEYGYHIMFFVGDYAKYEYECASAVVNEKQEKINADAQVTKCRGMSKVKVAQPQVAEEETEEEQPIQDTTEDAETSAEIVEDILNDAGDDSSDNSSK